MCAAERARCSPSGSRTVEPTEGISEVWAREIFRPKPPGGFLRFRVRVTFTYGHEFTRS